MMGGFPVRFPFFFAGCLAVRGFAIRLRYDYDIDTGREDRVLVLFVDLLPNDLRAAIHLGEFCTYN